MFATYCSAAVLVKKKKPKKTKKKLVCVTNTGAFFTEAAAAEKSSSIIPVFHWRRPGGAEPPAVQSVILQDVVNLRRRFVSFAELFGPAVLGAARPPDGNKHLKTPRLQTGATRGNGEKRRGCDDSDGRFRFTAGTKSAFNSASPAPRSHPKGRRTTPLANLHNN